MTNWNDLFGGGGGVFIAKKSYPVETIATGQTGLFKTLTPPLGQRIRITQFTATGISISLTTINVGGSDVVSAVSIVQNTGSLDADNEYIVGDGTGFIVGEVDEVITFSTNVSTTHVLELMYQEGVVG